MDMGHDMDRESPEIFTLQQVNSHGSSDLRNTPPQASMMPPPMALFDPDDNTRRFVGTPDYLAPETVRGEGQDETSDWWSVGCILFEFLFGYPPFHGDTPEHVFENILARKISWPDDEDVHTSPLQSFCSSMPASRSTTPLNIRSRHGRLFFSHRLVARSVVVIRRTVTDVAVFTGMAVYICSRAHRRYTCG